MPSLNTIAMNQSIPKPIPIIVREGNPNEGRRQALAFKRAVAGNSKGRRNQWRMWAKRRQREAEMGLAGPLDGGGYSPSSDVRSKEV